jgi:glutamyl-tRNA(Gln) amidotransferase subunit E
MKIKYTPPDVNEIGLSVGLEIHQQLRTEKKLFCRCESGRKDEETDAIIVRHMRPTLSEFGEYDGTALMEFKTNKEIIYHLNTKSVCTYEMDDTPPFEINKEALEKAITLAHLFNCTIVDEIHIIRKQYLDGSIPTGFQRTAIVGINGFIYVFDKKVKVIQVSIEEDACRQLKEYGHRREFEEDACRQLKEYGHRREFATDRLSVPLIEVVTDKTLTTPEEAKEASDVIRYITRSSGIVRTGHGAARQDVNVSIAGGDRVEIKGVSSSRLIPSLVYNEALRQHSLLSMKKNFQTTSNIISHDLTKQSYLISYKPIAETIKNGGKLFLIVVPDGKKILTFPLNAKTTFLHEISERLKVVACLTELPNILYPKFLEDKLEDFWHFMISKFKLSEEDGIFLVWGNEEDIKTAISEIDIRLNEIKIGVIRETRTPSDTGITGFERILPGPDRMYPDTDLPPIMITKELKEKTKLDLKPPWEIISIFEKEKISKSVLVQILRSGMANKCIVISQSGHTSLKKIANLMVRIIGRGKATRHKINNLSIDQMDKYFKLFSEKKISSRSLERLFIHLSTKNVNEANYPPVFSDDKIDKIITKALEEHPPFKGRIDSWKRFVMGIIMKKIGAHAEGKIVFENLLKKIK